MDDPLDDIIPKLPFNLPFIKKYVDDLILAIPRNNTDTILIIFNSYNNHIQFTIEEENNQSVSFLDTKLIRNQDNQIMLDW